MLETAREKLIDAARAHDIELKQTYAREGQALSRQAGRYAQARQFQRMRKAINRQRTMVGRLLREVQRKATQHSQAMAEALAKAGRVLAQTRGKKTDSPQGKLFSWHALEVRCFSKGKAKTPFEFGAKVGLAMTARGNLIVGARGFSGSPLDGHTLHEQLEQLEQSAILMQDADVSRSNRSTGI